MRKHKRQNTILIIMLIAALMCGSFVSGFAVTPEEKEAAEQAAKDAQKDADAKKNEAKEAAKKAAAAVANFEEAEAKLKQLEEEIAATEASISATKAEIEATKAKMDEKEAEIKDQNDALNGRLTAMYKTGNTSFVDVILNSESIEDLLSNVGMVHKILESDQEMLEKLQDDYKELEEMREELEAKKLELEDQEIALEAKSVETEELKKRYKEEADKLHEMQKQKEAEAAQMAAHAAAMQAEAERMIIEMEMEEDGKELGPMMRGDYAWPLSSNWIETDKYGWRICPFHGKEFHNGLDLALSSGTMGAPVYAIANGVVTQASWYGGYGNCIQYAIKGGYSVLCGHLSGFNCSEGQTIKKGQVIGYVGSTGASTGPHLHFTVFRGGETVDPYLLY